MPAQCQLLGVDYETRKFSDSLQTSPKGNCVLGMESGSIMVMEEL